jgi:PAS domain S-box-containing protein
MDELGTYIRFVNERLKTISPYLQKYALGDFSESIIVPEVEDEFTELLVSIRLMVDDFRELIQEKEETITKLKQVEAELLLKDIVFESSIAANSIADKDGVITHVNHTFLEMWGYETVDDAIGITVASFFVNTDDAFPVIESLNTTDRWEGRFLAKRRDDRTFISQGFATVIRNEQGEQIGYQSSNLDVTEDADAEEKLRQTLAVLERKNTELENFKRMSIGREHRMIELKREINALSEELEREAPYEITFSE